MALKHPTPAPKIPEHSSARNEAKEDKIDRQMEETFPASHPPSYSGGNHIIGAPEKRESAQPPDTAKPRKA
jgi:hypothetical protein